MFSADITGSFINDVFRADNSSANYASSSKANSTENSSSDISFQKDLQNRINEQSNEQKRDTFKEKEKVTQSFDAPAKPQETQKTQESSTDKPVAELPPTKTEHKTETTNKTKTTKLEDNEHIELNNLLEKLTELLTKLDTEGIEPTDEINSLLASIAILLESLSNPELQTTPNKNLFMGIASKIKQLNLTNPRTQENIPIHFINKKDLAELLNKISANLANKEMAQDINTSATNDITKEIASLLEKLNGVIESTQKKSYMIAETNIQDDSNVKETLKTADNKVSKDIKPTNETPKIETKENASNPELSSSSTEEQAVETAPKKQVSVKVNNEESLFNQNNKLEVKDPVPKVISLDNDLSEFNTKMNIREIREPEVVMPMQKNNQSNTEKQNQIMNQFRTFLTINKMKTDTEINMRLYPRELGEVKVKITKEQIAGNENTQIVAKFQVSSAAVKAILESNFDSLKNDLQQNSNIVISALSVEVADKNNQEQNFSNFFDNNFSSNKRAKATESIETLTEKKNILEQVTDNNEINSLA